MRVTGKRRAPVIAVWIGFLAVLLPPEVLTFASRSFNGTTGTYLSATDSVTLQSPSSAITVAMWVRWDASTQPSYPPMIKKNGNGNYSYLMEQVSTGAGSVEFYISTTAGSAGIGHGGTALTVGAWYFIVGRWASGGNVNLDVYNADGSLQRHDQSASTYTGTIVYTSSPNSGVLWVGGSGSSATAINGTITNIYVDNHSLTDPQVATLQGGTLPSGNPSALWAPLCGNSPESDLSGNGNNLSVNGSPTFTSQPSGVGGCSSLKGKLTGACALTGAGAIQ